MSTLLRPPSRARVFRRSLLTLACAAAAAPAWSQETPPADATGAQRVEITGSRIKQIDAEGASPVEVIRRDDIVKTGATSVRELLDTLTVTSTNGNTINDVNGSGTFSPGASQASLRNLGAQSTLLLVNGRRIAVYPLPNFQETFSNIDTIPLEAVERIEVLKTGGSAVYGSDAIAGVINIITRKDYRGIGIEASTQHSTRNGHFGEKSASITGGLGDYNTDGYNILGTVELFKRDSVMWSQILGDVNPVYGETSAVFGTGSTFSFPGNVDLQALPGCTGTISAGGACLYDRYSRFQAVPKTDRVNAMLSAHVRLDDKTDWYTEGMFSRIRADYQSTFQAYGPALVSLSWPGTGTSQKFYYRGLPAEHPLNPDGEEADFRYRFADSGSYDHPTTTQFRVLTGLKGNYQDWDYDGAIGIVGAHTRDRERGFFSHSGFLQEIGDPGQPDPVTGALPPLAPDFFNKPGGYVIGGPNTADVINTLFPEFGWDATTRQYFADGNATGKIYDLAAGPVNLSLGFELRHESQVLSPTANLAASDIVGLAYSASDASRNFGALFTELNVPLSKAAQLGLALRYDKFPHFAGHFSPRANLRFQANEDLLLRGTVETGFRAPNLQESAQSTKTAFQPGVSDPLRCGAASALIDDLLADADANPANADADFARAQQASGECGGSVPIVVQNNPGLKPEMSTSTSFGGVWQASHDWSVTADWWSIQRRNEINLRPVQDLLAAESSQPPGVIDRDPLNNATDPTFSVPGDYEKYGVTAGPLASIHQMWENLFKTRTEGLDFGINGVIATPIGRWTTGLQGTYTANYQVYSATRNGTGGWGDNLSGRYGYPKWSTVLSNSLKTGDFENTLRWTHQTGTKLQSDFDDDAYSPANCADTLGIDPGLCRIKNYNRWDYAVAWTGLKNLTVGANVINVFQKRPPVDMKAFGGNTGVVPVSNEDAAGRILKLYVSYHFL